MVQLYHNGYHWRSHFWRVFSVLGGIDPTREYQERYRHEQANKTKQSWMDNIFFFLKAFIITGVITRIIPFMDTIFWLVKHIPSFTEKEARHRGFINEKLAHRLQVSDPKPDLYIKQNSITFKDVSDRK